MSLCQGTRTDIFFVSVNSRLIAIAGYANEMIANDSVKIFFEGRLDARSELIRHLSANVNATDSQLLLAAYLKWGQHCTDFLLGDFAFVIVDKSNENVFAACDPMNMYPLYYHLSSDGVCFSSRARLLADLPGVSREVDKIALMGWLSGWPDPQRSLFSHIHLLPSGHQLVWQDEKLRVNVFWQIDPAFSIRYPRLGDYASHLSDVLSQSVADRLRSKSEKITAQLSGGLDSTTVCAFAKQHLLKQNRQLTCLSHSYEETDNCNETGLIHEVITHLDIRESHFLSAETYVDLNFNALYPPDFDSPGTVLSPRYIEELNLVQALGADVMLTGSGGDEMVWGHSLTYFQRLRRGEVSVIAEVIRGSREFDLPVLSTLLQLFLKPMLPERMLQMMRVVRGKKKHALLPDWIPAAIIKRMNLDHHLFQESTVQFDNRALQARYEALRRTSTMSSVRSYQNVANSLGIEVRHPFFDRRLAEFSFAIPDDLWIRDNYPKWLLRKTINDKLPSSVVWKKNKVIFNRFFGKVIAQQADLIRHILSNTQLQDMGFIDNKKLLNSFDLVVKSKGRHLNVELLYALLTQIWFQKYF